MPIPDCKDLAAANANRDKVPWIIVTSHFPLQNTMLVANSGKSARHYVGNDGEDGAGRAFTEHHFADCQEEQGCFTVGELVAAQAGLADPIPWLVPIWYNAIHCLAPYGMM